MYHDPHHSWKDLSAFDPANIPVMSVPEYSSQPTPTPEDLYDVFHNRSECERFGELSVEEREEFLTRIKQPYPKDVTLSTQALNLYNTSVI